MSRHAVILAGGKGSRLGPYTTVLPKPLLPIGDRAILDVVVRQLGSSGFDELTLAVGYLAHLVKAVFGDGSAHGVRITYQEEDRPLGTAGALGSIPAQAGPFLVMNGDLLTTIDYRQLLEAHVASGNIFTIATHPRVVHIDYGVLHVSDGAGGTAAVTDYEEKPEIAYTVSMGVYVASPAVLDYVPADAPLDMPDLVLKLIHAGERVGSYPYDGFWLDIGRHEDYELAVQQYDQLKHQLGLNDAEPALSQEVLAEPPADPS